MNFWKKKNPIQVSLFVLNCKSMLMFVSMWSLMLTFPVDRDQGLKHFLKYYLAVAKGFLNTKMTESPLKNIFEMKRSLLTGFDFFLPFPVFGCSVHISLTFSRTMLQCLKIVKKNFEHVTFVAQILYTHRLAWCVHTHSLGYQLFLRS